MKTKKFQKVPKALNENLTGMPKETKQTPLSLTNLMPEKFQKCSTHPNVHFNDEGWKGMDPLLTFLCTSKRNTF